jgi:hypothetical protein
MPSSNQYVAISPSYTGLSVGIVISYSVATINKGFAL